MGSVFRQRYPQQVRHLLPKIAIAKAVDEVWGTDTTNANFAAENFAAAVRFMRDPEKALGRLQPATDEQKTAVATAKSTLESIEQSRLHMSFACPLRFPIRSS